MSAAGESRAAPVASPSRRRRRSGLRDRTEHLLFLLFERGLRTLAPGSASRVGARLARLYLAASSSRRRILLANLQAAFPDRPRSELEALGRASVGNFGAAFVEFLESTRLSKSDVEDRIEVVGRENLEAARARGKGVFLLSAHLGSWEFGAVRAGMLGEPIASVVRPLDNARLEGELAWRRMRFGNDVIRKKEAAREILKRLRANGTVAILIDQNVLPEEAVFVPFFGRLAATSPSLALLQLKTDAAVVPSFVFPLGSGRYRLEFEHPILASDFSSAAGREERVLAGTARYMEVTERAVRRDPSAWLWLHNRWRTRPPGE